MVYFFVKFSPFLKWIINLKIQDNMRVQDVLFISIIGVDTCASDVYM